MADKHDAADAATGLALLWGTSKKTSRGPKPGLRLEQIAACAVELADAEGLAALSMQRVAARLGFTTMSLYRYMPGKSELVDLMLDAAIGAPPALDRDGNGWRERLQEWARAHWELVHRHPWMLELATRRRLMGPNELAWIEAGLRAVDGIGLNGEEMLDVVVLVNGFVRGLAQASLNSAQAEHHDGVSDAQWWAAYAPLLDAHDREGRYPTLRRILDTGAFGEVGDGGHADALSFGLQRVLDGVEAFVARRGAELERRTTTQG